MPYLTIIDTAICTKENLIEKICKKIPKITSERIKQLLDDFIDTVSFLVEYPYVES